MLTIFFIFAYAPLSPWRARYFCYAAKVPQNALKGRRVAADSCVQLYCLIKFAPAFGSYVSPICHSLENPNPACSMTTPILYSGWELRIRKLSHGHAVRVVGAAHQRVVLFRVDQRYFINSPISLNYALRIPNCLRPSIAGAGEVLLLCGKSTQKRTQGQGALPLP